MSVESFVLQTREVENAQMYNLTYANIRIVEHLQECK